MRACTRPLRGAGRGRGKSDQKMASVKVSAEEERLTFYGHHLSIPRFVQVMENKKVVESYNFIIQSRKML